MSHPLDLHKDRLATTDEEGGRIFLHPLEVRGFFRKYRTIVYSVLMLLFLILPWTKINGVQTILLDIPQRRFSIFGVTFWAYEAPLVFFVLAGTAFSLAFAAAVWGRVWCGWMCPQTVFIDIIYRRIEGWIEGSALARRAASAKPMTLGLFCRKILKWIAFTLVTLIISHSFIAYFVGAERVIYMIQGPPSENFVAFLFTFVISAILLFDFGWFREQFCVIMCPYGRLQGILMDKHSLTVMYDAKRGEPRGKSSQKTGGDCVDCYRCVSVCPTGVDIRRGQQLECIACTACIDACDEIMDKVKKPRGLIRYDRVESSLTSRHRWLRPSTAIYAVIIALIALGLTITLALREPISVEVLRARGAPFTDGGEGRVVNRFQLEINNTLFQTLTVDLANKDAASPVQIVMALRPLTVAAGKTSRVDFFVQFPASELKAGHAKSQLVVVIKNKDETLQLTKELPLVGPFH